MNCETPASTTETSSSGLPRSFFSGDVVDVARACLGLELESHTRSGSASGRIVEVEAYRGPDDRAAHSHGGRRTARTEAMFGPPGHAYVFLIYGIHTHLNVVAGDVGQPQAVLIRALEPLTGLAVMEQRRARSGGARLDPRALCNGPGKLCQALDVTRRFNACDLLARPSDPEAEYVLLKPGTSPQRIGVSPRIGIDYAGEWAAKPWRFFDQDSPCVSRAPQRKRDPNV